MSDAGKSDLRLGDKASDICLFAELGHEQTDAWNGLEK